MTTETEPDIYPGIAELPIILRYLLQLLTIIPLVLILMIFGTSMEAPL